MRFRWKIAVLMFCGIAINYIDRIAISHAILVIAPEWHLTMGQQAVILSSFSWGYVGFMVFGGWLVDRHGARLINAATAGLWSLFTGLAAITTGFGGLLITRIFVGAAEAAIFPGNARVVRTWFQLDQRGRATAIFDSGSYFGSAIGAPLVIGLILLYGWRKTFWILCGLGLLWGVTWYFHYRDQDSSVSHRMSTSHQWSGGTFSSIAKLMRQRKLFGMCMGFFCYNYVKSFYLTWLPTYLVSDRHLAFSALGVVALIPHACAIIGLLLSGSITDALVRSGVSITIARKAPICLGLFLSSTIVLAPGFRSNVLALLFLTLSYTALISASSGIWALPGDVSNGTTNVGIIGALQNTFSNIAGIVAPIITGILSANTGSFFAAMCICAAMGLVGALAYWYIVGEVRPLQDA
jgi:ACS family D-galactonate transporter-like MFS transporter